MKCPQCGLVNFQTATACKRCGTPLSSGSEMLDQTSGAWRDSDLLVIGEHAQLPERCMKCNSSVGVSQKVATLGYYPKYNLALLLFGFVYYKSFNVGLYLCERHFSSRNRVLLSILLIFGGIVTFSVGYSSFFLVIAGFVMLAVGFILLAVGGNPVSIVRFEEPYIWLKGVDKEYLSTLPHWTEG